MEISLDDLLGHVKTSFINGYSCALRKERSQPFADTFPCHDIFDLADMQCRFFLSNMRRDKLISDEVFYEKIKMFQ